jgi:hypothetical protein
MVRKQQRGSSSSSSSRRLGFLPKCVSMYCTFILTNICCSHDDDDDDDAFDFDFEIMNCEGTVMDAYSKISIGFRNHVTQRKPNNVNVIHMLGGGSSSTGNTDGTDHGGMLTCGGGGGGTTTATATRSNGGITSSYGTSTLSVIGCAIGLCTDSGDDYNMDNSKWEEGMYITLPGEARILISHTGKSGKQGAVRGDVVTHVDGQSVAGRTVNQFLQLLRDKLQQQEGTTGTENSATTTILLTLNAERSVADALKRRARAISEM